MLKPLTISVLFWPCILLGETGSEVLRLKPAAKYIAEKGVLKPKEVLVWSGPEKPAAGWKGDVRRLVETRRASGGLIM